MSDNYIYYPQLHQDIFHFNTQFTQTPKQPNETSACTYIACVSRKGYLLIPRHIVSDAMEGTFTSANMRASCEVLSRESLNLNFLFSSEPSPNDIGVTRHRVKNCLLNLKILFYKLNLNYRTHEFAFECHPLILETGLGGFQLRLVRRAPWPEFHRVNVSPTFWPDNSSQLTIDTINRVL